MLSSQFRIKEGMVWFRSGHFYTFYYKNYQNDPIPMIVMLNYVHGTHPTTGKVHNYIQAINLSYVPRQFRKKFLKVWEPTLKNNKGNVRLTWSKVVGRWPFMMHAVRRYLVRKNLIKYAREIPTEKINEEVVSTLTRDYSIVALKQKILMTERITRKNPKAHMNIFKKSLSKYIYKYRTGGF